MTNKLTKAIQGIDKYVDLLEEKVELLTQYNDTQADIIASQKETIENQSHVIALYEEETTELKQQRDEALFDRDCWKERSGTPWELYQGAIKHIAAERDTAIELAEGLKQDVKHWQNQFDTARNFGTQVVTERDDLYKRLEAQRKKTANWRKRAKKLETESAEALNETLLACSKQEQFIETICNMVACDADLEDIADECIRWQKGEWQPTNIVDLIGNIIDEDDGSFFGGEQKEDPYRWAVYVVEEQGDDAVFTGFFSDYDKARESVDLMVARGCYEAWVEDKA